tara:strand:- start:3402 stop:3584 length:183 start_codon:yes stop_codon:yes gene_type:complete
MPIPPLNLNVNQTLQPDAGGITYGNINFGSKGGALNSAGGMSSLLLIGGLVIAFLVIRKI